MTSLLPTTGHVDLVRRYVEDILNHRRTEEISEIFSVEYRDLHPLIIPGVLNTAQPDGGTIADLTALVDLLAQPGVDVHFTLEDVFAGPHDRVAYRLFGEGTVPLVDTQPANGHPGSSEGSATSGGTSVRKLAIPNTSLTFGGLSPESGRSTPALAPRVIPVCRDISGEKPATVPTLGSGDP